MTAKTGSRAAPAFWTSLDRATRLHLGVIALLFLLQFILPAYHHGIIARTLVLATYALGYNLLFGYTGLLSLGHAMFFAAGMYGAGLTANFLGWVPPVTFVLGIGAGAILAVGIGLLALRTTGVAFMIVTMMFAQAGYLLSLYFGTYTRGDDGFVIPAAARQLHGLGASIDLANPDLRYNLALALFAASLAIVFAIVRAPAGRVLIAIRENEERTRMLGYDTHAYKLLALVVSGAIAAAAGAAYALLFGYVGASFAFIQYSIYPLLWVLLGGAGTILGPLVGTIVMFYLVDITSGFTSAYLFVVGLALVLLVLWFPKGLLGSLRDWKWRWLP